MDLGIAAAVFPIIFIGELPDKTMFASLVLATRGRPRSVWLGAAAAFLVHVVIATTIGVGLFALLPHRAVEGLVAALFLGGALYAFIEGNRDESDLIEREARSHRQVVTTAFVVIFLAEWGDLTQILTANLAAHYHQPLSVGVGAVLALWCVAALAVAGGQRLLRVFSISLIRRVTGVVLLVLAGITAWAAING
ncbi:MAG TPA: TMEM165/GDT1 family protein [Acidimicrobiia bacterium]|nr:TMEM165/GDT1 family protein [Acidimicrobiia bacterium]